MPKEKIRLDELLVIRGFCEDSKKAQSLILSGSVLIEEQKLTKAGVRVSPNVRIRLLEIIPKNVSRAATKLNYAIGVFKIDVNKKICLDFGASTGGFTQTLLEHGAEKVYAFDVGYGQLAGKLRNDKRVIVRDRFNVKNISVRDFQNEDNKNILIVIDVSFISLTSVFPSIAKLKIESPGILYEVVCLIKPQFECPKEALDKGIVKKKGVHFKVIRKICKSVQNDFRGNILGICESPILGAKGNKEFLLHWVL